MLTKIYLEKTIELDAIAHYVQTKYGKNFRTDSLFNYDFFKLPIAVRKQALSALSDFTPALKPGLKEQLEEISANDNQKVVLMHQMPIALATSFAKKLGIEYRYILHTDNADDLNRYVEEGEEVQEFPRTPQDAKETFSEGEMLNTIEPVELSKTQKDIQKYSEIAQVVASVVGLKEVADALDDVTEVAKTAVDVVETVKKVSRRKKSS